MSHKAKRILNTRVQADVDNAVLNHANDVTTALCNHDLYSNQAAHTAYDALAKKVHLLTDPVIKAHIAHVLDLLEIYGVTVRHCEALTKEAALDSMALSAAGDAALADPTPAAEAVAEASEALHSEALESFIARHELEESIKATYQAAADLLKAGVRLAGDYTPESLRHAHEMSQAGSPVAFMPMPKGGEEPSAANDHAPTDRTPSGA